MFSETGSRGFVTLGSALLTIHLGSYMTVAQELLEQQKLIIRALEVQGALLVQVSQRIDDLSPVCAAVDLFVDAALAED